MAHSLGGLADSAHGECNAILLDHVIGFNFDAVPQRYAAIAQALGISSQTIEGIKSELIHVLGEFKKSCGIHNTLSKLGVTKEIIPNLAQNAYHDPCIVTNPKKATQEDIEAIYEAAL